MSHFGFSSCAVFNKYKVYVISKYTLNYWEIEKHDLCNMGGLQDVSLDALSVRS